VSGSDYYQSFIHLPVEIQIDDGSILTGIIESVDQDHVYILPFDAINEQRDGRNPGFFGPGFGQQAFWGGFAGSLLGIGLSTIIGIRPYPFGPPAPAYPPYIQPPYGPSYGPGPFY
jgi:hypothetical protein